METEVHSISHLPCPGVGCCTVERADIKLYLSKAQLLIRGERYTGMWWYRGIELIPSRYIFVRLSYRKLDTDYTMT